MDINDRLYVEIHPLTSGQIPHPHPIDEAGFDLQHVYKVLGMYNPSETSECYFVLANPKRQIWFIPQRHLLAFGILESAEFSLTLEEAAALKGGVKPNAANTGCTFALEEKLPDLNGHTHQPSLQTKANLRILSSHV